MIKAIFFDIDCTLVSHATHSVPASTRAAIHKLRENGVKCVIATGRHLKELDFLPVSDMEFDGYITLNSQLCFDQDGNVIYSDPIPSPEKEFLLDFFHTNDGPVLLVSEKDWYLSMVTEDVENAQKNISSPVPAVGEYKGGDIYQVVVYGDREKYEPLKEQLPNCKMTWWDERAAAINSASGSKMYGIKRYLELNGIRQEETMAFGDGENDIEMLEFAHIGVAMGNSVPETVKDHADYVTTGVDDDGIWNALEHFGVL